MTAARKVPVFLPPDYESVMRTLPKSRAASLAWALKQCDAAIATLIAAEDARTVLRDAAVKFFSNTSVLLAELLPLVKATGASPLEPALERAETVIGGRLRDPAAAAALRWALTHSMAPAAHVGAIGALEIELVRAAQDELVSYVESPPGGLLRAQLLALASIEAANRTPPSPGAVELAWLAFEEATAAVDAIGPSAGIFAAAAPTDRSQAVLDAARWARESLTARDLRTIDEARVRTLR